MVDASQNWGGQQCSEWDIAHGQCNLCREPLWCNAEGSSSFGFNGAVQGDDDWWEMFGTSDGGLFKGSRQCKWKPSQQQEFIGSIRRRAREQQWHGFDLDAPGMWNEVNMYVGPNDGDAAGVMWRNLLGLVFIRGGGDEDPESSYGTDLDRSRLRQVRDRWRSLGVEVPIFELTMERWSRLDHWNSDDETDLSDDWWGLDYMDTPEGEEGEEDDD